MLFPRGGSFDGFRFRSTHPTSCHRNRAAITAICFPLRCSSIPFLRIAFAVEPFPPKLLTSPAWVPTGPVKAESSYAQIGKLPDREDLRSHEAEESHQPRDRRGD